MSKFDYRDHLRGKSPEAGCSDGSCFFQKNTGMVTNGGCSCLNHVGTTTRLNLHRIVISFNNEISRLNKRLKESETMKENK